MKKSENGTIIICLGGSLIAPKDGIDTRFLKNFKNALRPHLRKGMRFAIICGGGQICREYQKAMKNISDVGDEMVDRLGIKVTNLNAELVRALFQEYSPEKVVINPHSAGKYDDQVIIGAGWKPGWSTDYIAVLTAKALGAKDIATLSNIDYVYDKDPKKYDDSKRIEDITWATFRRDIVPNKWNPGAKSPFDPVASKEAEKQSITVAMMHGAKLKNFDTYLKGGQFKGTRIHN